MRTAKWASQMQPWGVSMSSPRRGSLDGVTQLWGPGDSLSAQNPVFKKENIDIILPFQ